MTSKVVATNIPWTKLEDLEKQGYISFLRGSGISKKDFDEKGSFPCIHYGDLYTAYQKPEISEVVHRTNFDGKVRSHIGDVLVPATTTADEMGIAIARAINKKGVVLGSDINILRTENKYLLSTYLSYIFNYGIKRELASYAKGTNILHLSNKDIKKLSIPVPSLPEQKRIVEKLDKIFADIDKAKENTEKNLEKAKEVFLNTLEYLFTTNTQHWPQYTLHELGHVQTGTTPTTSQKDNFGSFIPFIKPSDFHEDGTLDYNQQGLSQKGLTKSRLIKKGSILMVCIGATITKTGFCERDVACNQQINTLYPIKDDYKFLYYAMIRPSFKLQVIKESPKTTLPIINKTKWEKLTLKVPVLDEQKRIVAQLDTLLAKTKELEKIYTKKLADLDELKQSVLQQAFSGKL